MSRERADWWHAADDERRASGAYDARLVQLAPKASAIRDRGDILPTLVAPDRVDRIRSDTFKWLEEAFGTFDRTPGLALYPYGDDSTKIRGFAAVWRDDVGAIVAGASVLEATHLDVPPEIQDAFIAYDRETATPEQLDAFMGWWAANHHRLERGEVDSVAVRKDLPREQSREAVRALQLELARHRAYRRLAFERGPDGEASYAVKDSFALSADGARSLNAHRATLEVATAAAMALVKNPDALEGLIRMPDSGRALTRAEILRGVMDLAGGGSSQFHIEAVAVRESITPIVHDRALFERTFGFHVVELPGVTYIVRDPRGDGTQVHFEEATGDRSRLEYANAPVRKKDPGGHEDPGDGSPGEPGGSGGENGGGRGGRSAADLGHDSGPEQHDQAADGLTRSNDAFAAWSGSARPTITRYDQLARAAADAPTLPVGQLTPDRGAGFER